MNDEIESFRALVNQWGYAYKWAVVSYVALKCPNSEKLTIIAGRIGLEVTLYLKDIEALPVDFESASLIAGREIIQINGKLTEVLSGLDKGKLNATKIVAEMTLEGDNFSTSFLPYYPYSILEGPRQATLHIRGVNKRDVIQNIDQLNWELKAADKPYENLDELLGSLGLPTAARMDSTALEIVANSIALIHVDSIIESGKALLKCVVAEGLHIEKLKLGYKIFERDYVKRGHIAGSDFRWKPDGDIQTGEFELPVGESSVLQMFASYEGHALHQLWITDPNKHLNARYASYAVFDPDLKVLRDFLSAVTKKPGEDFEQGIATLLTMLGFSVSQYGTSPKLQNGPDIIAVTSLNNIAVIECTTKHLSNNDKISKLVLRTNQLKESLEKSGHAHLAIQPVIVTALPRSDVSADLQEAGRHGVAVITKEDIDLSLETQAPFLVNSEDIFKGFSNLIPDKKQAEFDLG